MSSKTTFLLSFNGLGINAEPEMIAESLIDDPIFVLITEFSLFSQL